MIQRPTFHGDTWRARTTRLAAVALSVSVLAIHSGPAYGSPHEPSVEPTSPAKSPAPFALSAKSIAGRTLAEWQQRLSSIDPQSTIPEQERLGLQELVASRDLPWYTRRQAALTLGRMGAPARSSVPIFVELLQDSDRSLEGPRYWSVAALARLGPVAVEAERPLIGILDDANEPIELRISTLEALGRIGPAGRLNLPALMLRLNRSSTLDDQTLRMAATESLSLWGPSAAPATPLLLRLLDDSNERQRQATLVTLAAIRPSQTSDLLPIVDRLLLDESFAVRAAAQDALGQIGSPAMELATELLDHADASVRLAAIQILHRIGPSARAVQPAVFARTTDADGLVRIAAWTFLRDVEAQSHVEAVKAAERVLHELRSDDRDVRRAAADWLATTKTVPRDLLLQLELLADDDSPAATAARSVLRRRRSREGATP